MRKPGHYNTNGIPFSKSVFRLFAFAFLFAIGTSAFAQLPYTRTTFAGAYTAISVGGGATATTITGDDGTQTLIPIGFTFTYNATPFTTVDACANGWVSFGAAGANQWTNSNLFTATTPNNTLAPWWDDLGVTAPTGVVLYQTQGVTPNQTFTVQWTDVNSYQLTTTKLLNFQVILYETTNVIEFRYGTQTGVWNTAESASIGIEGATGGAGNFLDVVSGSAWINNSFMNTLKWPTAFFRLTPGAPPPIPGGTYTVGSTGTFPSLSEAIVALNHTTGILGPVTLSLTDALYDTTVAGGRNVFPMLLGPVAGNSAANTITIQPASGTSTFSFRGDVGGSGGNQTTATNISTAVEPIFGIVGTDYVTMRNLNLNTTGNGLVDRGLYVINATGTNGAQNNLFENISVNLLRSSTTTIGIQQNVLTTATSAAGANSNNIYRNLSITNSYAGMYLLGNATFPDLTCQIGNTVPTNFNTIGSATANDIGGAAFGTQSYGIRAGNQSGVKIFNNQVQNVSTLSGTVDGILVELSQGVTEVYNNKISAIRNAGTASTLNACGIRANLATTLTHSSRIYNNWVSNISSGYTGAGTATRIVKGIFVQSAGGGLVGETINVDFNSVSIDGSGFLNASNTCYEIGTATGPVINTRNNIFANFTAAQTAPANHLAWRSTAATTVGNTGSSSNYNDLYIANATEGYTGQGNATNYATLANWQAAMTGQDLNSVACDPGFVANNSNLHITSVCANALANASGSAWVTVDIDQDPRTGTPDIGADEAAACVAAVGGTVTPATAGRCQGLTYTMTSTGASSAIGISYQWKVGAVSGGPYANVVGGSGATTTSYTTAALATPGVYYFVLEVTCGAATGLSTQLTLTVNGLPTIGVTPTTGLICNPGGSAVTLTASGGLSYAWSPTAGLSPTSGSPVSANPTATTTYTVTGTDVNGCVNTATATITVASSVTVSALATPATICSGGNSVLTANGTLASGTYCQPVTSCTFPDIITNVTFSTINNTTTCDGAGSGGYSAWPTPNPTLTAGNNYALTVSTGGDTEGAGVWIDYNQDGVFQGSEQILNGYLGTNPATYTNAAVLIPLTALNGTTRMRVRATYATNPNTLLDPPCTNVTFGETEDYTVTIVGGTTPVSYTWSPGTFLSGTTGSPVNANAVTSTTTYTVTATSGAGCTSTATATVTIATSATVTPAAAAPYCDGVAVVISSNATGGAPITYLWSNGATTPTISVTNVPGSYTYSVTATDACGSVANGSATFTVNGLPTVIAGQSAPAVCNPGGVGITMTAAGATSYTWNPNTGLAPPSGPSVFTLPTATTVYVVTGTDANGCMDTDTLTVGVGQSVSGTATVVTDSICSGDSSTLIAVGTYAPFTYCQPVYTNGTGFGDYVSSVALNTLANATLGAPAPYYTLYPASGATTTTLTAGNTYTITLSPGTYTFNDLAAWIDFNQNGTLNDLGEKLGETDDVAATPATTAFTFTVPLTATNGVTRLRVRDVDHGGINDMDPCLAQSTFGETEDYDITIVGGVSAALIYTWTPPTFLLSTNTDTVVAAGVTATTAYTVIMASAVGCADTASVTLSLSTTPPVASCASAMTYYLDSLGMVIVNAMTLDSGSTDLCGLDTFTVPQDTFTCANLGANPVTVTVTNINGISSTCNSNIIISDTLPPLLICPLDVAVNASACTDTASWTPPSGSDNCGMNTVFGTANPGDSFAPGNTTVTYTGIDMNGNSGTCNFIVTMNAASLTLVTSATPGTSICEGDTVTLTVNATGNISVSTYSWSTGATTQSTTDIVTITTTYTVTVTDSCGTSYVDSITITLSPNPVASFTFAPTTVHAGEVITFTNTSTNATSSSWDFGDTGTSSLTSPTHTYTATGPFTVTLIVTNACGSDTTTQTMTVLTGITDGLGNGSIAVYPNPNQGLFNLDLNNLAGRELKVVITDMRGVAVVTKDLNVTTDFTTETLDITGFASGMYFVKVISGDNYVVSKITKE